MFMVQNVYSLLVYRQFSYIWKMWNLKNGPWFGNGLWDQGVWGVGVWAKTRALLMLWRWHFEGKGEGELKHKASIAVKYLKTSIMEGLKKKDKTLVFSVKLQWDLKLWSIQYELYLNQKNCLSPNFFFVNLNLFI